MPPTPRSWSRCSGSQDFLQRAAPGVTAAFIEFVGTPGFTLDQLGGVPGDELTLADY